ncbi:hypothetical protein FQA39_LY02342 [Lamprigera yunnana]|nr:hypothetical protein FQA39_LY02342 [Lamprigera yunnana]
MALRFAVLAVLVAFVTAGGVPVPIGYGIPAEYDPNPQYSYKYAVNDPFTGDSKSQIESRSGDHVQGQYSLLESDGTKRIVDYAADPVNGFNAIVNKVPAVAADPVVPVVKSATAIPTTSLAYSGGYFPYASQVGYPYAGHGYGYPYAGLEHKHAYGGLGYGYSHGRAAYPRFFGNYGW